MNRAIYRWRTARPTKLELVDAELPNDDDGDQARTRTVCGTHAPRQRKRWKLRADVALAIAALWVGTLACGRIGFAPTQSSPDDGGSSTFSIAGATVNPNTRHTMVATGGIEPFQFNILAGQASINKVTGELRTPMFSQDVVIEARDASNQVATTTMVVDGSHLYYAAGRDSEVGEPGSSAVYASPDGVAWSTRGTLPAARFGGGMVAYTPR